MTRDELERALRSAVDPHETAYRAAPLPASVEDARQALQSTSRRSAVPWGVVRVLAVAAVAVVAVVGISAGYRLMTGEWGPGTGEGPLATGGASVSAVPSASASASAAPRACRAADFSVTSDPWDGAAGSRGTRVVFRAVDSLDACVLGGRLTARIVDASGAELVTGYGEGGPATALSGGTQLEIGVAWSNWCGPVPAEPLELRVRLPSDSTEVAIAPPAGTSIPVPPCMGAGQDTALSVTGFQPSDRPAREG